MIPIRQINSVIYSGQSLTVSGGATPTLTSSKVYVGELSKLNVFVANGGTSTNCTVEIRGSPESDSALSSQLAVFTLGASGTSGAKAGRYLENFPSYVYAIITNLDAVAGHTAAMTVILDRFR